MKKSDNGFIELRTRNGSVIKVDISDEACLRFGFKHGERVIHPKRGEATIMGVGGFVRTCDCDMCRISDENEKDVNSRKVLWYVLDITNGLASAWSRDPKETFLPDQGFKKVNAGAKKD